MTKITWVLCVAALFFGGCAARQLRLKMHATSVQKPGNVVVFFSVEDWAGHPVGALAAEQFRIYEDAQIVSPYESKQTILNPEVAISHHALLLLDLSGSITETGSTKELIKASSFFVDRLTQSSQTEVAIFGFDGAKDLHQISPFTKNANAAKAALARLADFKARDPSTNLHGAVVQGLALLEEKVSHATLPIRFSTLVIFTDGTDRAHRISEQEVDAALKSAEVDVFAVGLGSEAEISAEQLSWLGAAGYVRASDQLSLSDAFRTIAEQIDGASQKFYILSYCSPSRAGVHRLEVEAMSSERSGSFSYEFDANDFGPACDPNRKPTFSIERILLQQRDSASPTPPGV